MCLVQDVMGDRKPNGSKTLALLESTVRFVSAVVDGIVSKENTLVFGFYFNPCIFNSNLSLSLLRRAADNA